MYFSRRMNVPGIKALQKAFNEHGLSSCEIHFSEVV